MHGVNTETFCTSKQTNYSSDQIQKLLFNLLETILNSCQVKRFPILSESIKNHIHSKLNKQSHVIKQRILELIDIEKNYIWSEDKNFISDLEKHAGKSSFESNIMKKIVTSY